MGRKNKQVLEKLFKTQFAFHYKMQIQYAAAICFQPILRSTNVDNFIFLTHFNVISAIKHIDFYANICYNITTDIFGRRFDV